VKPCAVCGDPFTPARCTQPTCGSPACRREFVRLKYIRLHPGADSRNPAEPFACLHCGAPVPRSKRRPRKYCGKGCHLQWQMRQPGYRDHNRDKAARAHRARAATGLCVDAGCELDRVPGRTRCRKHLDSLNARTREAKRKARAVGKLIGRCDRCCKRPAVVGLTMCVVCRGQMKHKHRGK
jgi:hypothetical protein